MTEVWERLEPVWRHLRALFVVFHLVAVIGIALPSVGGGMNRSAWKAATVQDEFAVWANRLQGVGLQISVAELEDALWEFAVGYERGRRDALQPFARYYRYAGTSQSWRMFVAPHRYPGRLVIDVDEGEGFTRVYEARSSEFTWGSTWFDHDRMRSAVFRYAWPHFRRPRSEFTSWVADQAADAFPHAHRVRVGFLRYRTRSPDEVRQGVMPKVKLELSNIRNLDKIRQEAAEGE